MKGNRIPMRTVTSDDTDRVSQMESWLDNPLYQRLDYAEDCKVLGITDIEIPQLLGMLTTTILKSWQVTGVKAMVDFEADPQLSACILAGATDLGKTIDSRLRVRANSNNSLSARKILNNKTQAVTVDISVTTGWTDRKGRVRSWMLHTNTQNACKQLVSTFSPPPLSLYLKWLMEKFECGVNYEIASVCRGQIHWIIRILGCL